VFSDLLVVADQLDPPDLPVNQDLPDHLDLSVRRPTVPDQPDHQVHRVRLDNQVFKDQQEALDLADHRDHLDQQDLWVLLVLQEHSDHREVLDIPVFQVLLDHRDPPDHLEMLARQVSLVSAVR